MPRGDQCSVICGARCQRSIEQLGSCAAHRVPRTAAVSPRGMVGITSQYLRPSCFRAATAKPDLCICGLAWHGGLEVRWPIGGLADRGACMSRDSDRGGGGARSIAGYSLCIDIVRRHVHA